MIANTCHPPYHSCSHLNHCCPHTPPSLTYLESSGRPSLFKCMPTNLTPTNNSLLHPHFHLCACPKLIYAYSHMPTLTPVHLRFSHLNMHWVNFTYFRVQSTQITSYTSLLKMHKSSQFNITCTCQINSPPRALVKSIQQCALIKSIQQCALKSNHTQHALKFTHAT